MNSKKFALIGGSIMLGAGLLALIPSLSFYNLSLPHLNVEISYGYFLRIFPMNIFNKLALILFGIAGIMCNSSISVKDLSPSIIWSRVVLYTMGALAVLGTFQPTSTLGGYWPLFGNEIWFHGLFAVIGGYFGYIAHEDVSRGSRTTFHRV